MGNKQLQKLFTSFTETVYVIYRKLPFVRSYLNYFVPVDNYTNLYPTFKYSVHL